MVTTDVASEIAYWRELATARGLELELLRKRVLELLDSLPNASAIPLTSMHTARGSWIEDVDRIPSSPELEPSDVVTAIGQLWNRVAADR